MKLEPSENIKSSMDTYIQNNKIRYGIISINHLLFNSSLTFLQNVIQKYQILNDNLDFLDRNQLIEQILEFFEAEFSTNTQVRKNFSDSMCYLGKSLFDLVIDTDFYLDFDFIAKTDLINVFADYCADLGINTYDARKIESYDFDLYLIKKTQGVFVTTESVIIRTLFDMEQEQYEELIAKIARSTMVAEWKLFVTTPAVAMKIGLDNLIADMKRLNTWLYIIDPLQKRVFGITKGKKNKARDAELRDRLIQQLPQTPIRASSQVISLSKYEFEEKYAYKPKNIRNFILNPLDSIEHESVMKIQDPPYRSIFQSVLIVDKETSLTLYSFHTNPNKFDDQMISGFLSAMDSFVRGFGGSKGTEEISYKGFIVQAVTGKKIKAIAILSHSTDPAFTERLQRFVFEVEQRYASKINQFLENGENNLIQEESINNISRKFLGI